MRRRDFMRLLGLGAPATAAAVVLLRDQPAQAVASPPPLVVARYSPHACVADIDRMVKQLQAMEPGRVIALPHGLDVEWRYVEGDRHG